MNVIIMCKLKKTTSEFCERRKKDSHSLHLMERDNWVELTAGSRDYLEMIKNSLINTASIQATVF